MRSILLIHFHERGTGITVDVSCEEPSSNVQKELPVKRELAGRLMLVAEKSVPVRSGGEFQELKLESQ